jgi:hypothetical protein
MTNDELDRLQALADEATAGPWTAAATVDEYGQRLHTVDVLPLTTFGEIELNDAAFIAASRDAVPALIAEVRRLREENARSLDAWLRHEGIQPDGEMCATVSSVLAENERLREEIDEWHRISERWGRASGKQYGKLATIRDLANARLADTAHMASIQEAETLWAIVAATEGE